MPPVALADYIKKKIVPSVKIIPVNILRLENQLTLTEPVSENRGTDAASHCSHEWPLQAAVVSGLLPCSRTQELQLHSKVSYPPLKSITEPDSSLGTAWLGHPLIKAV